MSRADDLEAQVLAALEERTSRGEGWVSLPSPDPIHDAPHILKTLQDNGILQRTSVTIIPSEDEPGWWEFLLVKVEVES